MSVDCCWNTLCVFSQIPLVDSCEIANVWIEIPEFCWIFTVSKKTVRLQLKSFGYFSKSCGWIKTSLIFSQILSIFLALILVSTIRRTNKRPNWKPRSSSQRRRLHKSAQFKTTTRSSKRRTGQVTKRTARKERKKDARRSRNDNALPGHTDCTHETTNSECSDAISANV